MSLQERPYPYVVASSEKFRVVRWHETGYSLDEWDDDRYDSMDKPLGAEWTRVRSIWLGDGVTQEDKLLAHFIEIMENGWTTSGVQQP